jgi:hypothetical protein
VDRRLSGPRRVCRRLGEHPADVGFAWMIGLAVRRLVELGLSAKPAH